MFNCAQSELLAAAYHRASCQNSIRLQRQKRKDTQAMLKDISRTQVGRTVGSGDDRDRRVP